jgi:hypothetical protein
MAGSEESTAGSGESSGKPTRAGWVSMPANGLARRRESSVRLMGPAKAKGPPAGPSERLTGPGKARGPPAESKKSSGGPAVSGGTLS